MGQIILRRCVYKSVHRQNLQMLLDDMICIIFKFFLFPDPRKLSNKKSVFLRQTVL